MGEAAFMSSFAGPVNLTTGIILSLTSFQFAKNHGYAPQGKPMDPNSAAEQRGIIPSAFCGIVRLTNFLSLHSKNLSLTNNKRFEKMFFNPKFRLHELSGRSTPQGL